MFEQNLHISSKSHPSISWRPRVYPTVSCLSNPWRYHTKPKKCCISPTPLHWVGYSYLLLQMLQLSSGRSSEPSWQWVPNRENSPLFFVFLFDVYSSPVVWMSHWVKFIMPSLVSLRGNPLWEIYSGSWAKRFWESHHTSIIHHCVWTTTVDWILFQRVQIYFH